MPIFYSFQHRLLHHDDDLLHGKQCQFVIDDTAKHC